MRLSPFVLPILLVSGAMTLAACDVVKFPGANERDAARENSVPPPPPTDPVNPIPIGDDVLEGIDADRPAGTNLGDGQTTRPNIADLAEISAIRCAPATEDTMTLAEATGARPAEAGFEVQTVSGTPVLASAFPGIVKMEPKRELPSGGVSSGHCSATRISQNWFVTAAHCLDSTYDEVQLIATDSDLRNPFATRLQATASICHAAYGGASGQYMNDIALVRISDAAAADLTDVPIARFGDTQAPFNQANYPTVRMAGWGLTGFNGSLSNTLLSAELDVSAAGPAAITISSREAAGPCIGDSGGPLQVIDRDGEPTVI
ncbi:MAG: trypsin-like serine protease, partial [Pseudomonadota bacterium]